MVDSRIAEIRDNILDGKDWFKLYEKDDVWFIYNNENLYLIGEYDNGRYVIYQDKITIKYLKTSIVLKKLDAFLKWYEAYNKMKKNNFDSKKLFLATSALGLAKVEVLFKIKGENLIVEKEANDEFKSYLEENLGQYKIRALALSSIYAIYSLKPKIDEFFMKNILKWSDEDIECINKFFEENIDIDYSLDYFTFGECDNDSVTIIANVSGDLFLKEEKLIQLGLI